MRELKQDWRDLFGGFKVAFDIWKLVLAFLGLAISILCIWGMSQMPPTVALGILTALVALGVFIKFVTSETGLTSKKSVGLIGVVLVLAGLVVMLHYMLNPLIIPLATLFTLLVIWALFGGAISRIAVVEICTDDRLSIGEALCYARRRYTAYLGATILPLVAVAILMLCCFAYGLLFTLPIINVVLSLCFFLVLIAGFMMALIILGGVAGAPLMYPAVSAEGNDAFDAISRSYSYVFGRPWRFLFYNLMAFIYGVTCVFFVTMFVLGMIWISTVSVKAATDGLPDDSTEVSYSYQEMLWRDQIVPRVLNYTEPVVKGARGAAECVTKSVRDIDPTGYVGNLCGTIMTHLDKGLTRIGDNPGTPPDEAPTGVPTSAFFVAIAIYGLIGLVLSYIVSLYFSLQSSIYLLLRKAVDGADMTEVYLEEEMADGHLEEGPAKSDDEAK